MLQDTINFLIKINILHHLNLLFFTSIGSFVLYCKLKTEERPIIEFMVHLAPHWNSTWKPFIEAIIFLVIGSIVAYGLVHPTTIPQAISAGLGWTGLVSALSDKK